MENVKNASYQSNVWSNIPQNIISTISSQDLTEYEEFPWEKFVNLPKNGNRKCLDSNICFLCT